MGRSSASDTSSQSMADFQEAQTVWEQPQWGPECPGSLKSNTAVMHWRKTHFTPLQYLCCFYGHMLCLSVCLKAAPVDVFLRLPRETNGWPLTFWQWKPRQRQSGGPRRIGWKRRRGQRHRPLSRCVCVFIFWSVFSLKCDDLYVNSWKKKRLIILSWYV